MFTVRVTGDDVVIAKLSAMPNAVHQSLLRKVTVLAFKLLALVKGKLSGEVLNVRSGLLRDSAFQEVIDGGSSVVGRVAEPGLVPYAAIHEFGGTINHPGGTAYWADDSGAHFVSNAAAEAFQQLGGALAVKGELRRTRAHSIQMPERSYLRSALAEMEEEIVSGLREAVAEGTAALRT